MTDNQFLPKKHTVSTFLRLSLIGLSAAVFPAVAGAATLNPFTLSSTTSGTVTTAVTVVAAADPTNSMTPIPKDPAGTPATTTPTVATTTTIITTTTTTTSRKLPGR